MKATCKELLEYKENLEGCSISTSMVRDASRKIQ